MAKIKLKAVLTATLTYEVDERFGGFKNVTELCRHEEEAMREDPTEFCDSGRVKFHAKVERVRPEKP